MKESERMLFNAVKNHNDALASATLGLCIPDLEFDPDAEVPDLNLLDEQGFAPLHYAVKRGLRITVARLLKEGAAVDVKDKIGRMPLVLAMEKLSPREINDPKISSDYGSDKLKIIENLVACDASINARDLSEYGSGRTCVHMAVSANHVLALRALLANKADRVKYLEVTDENGWTPLHLAALNGDVYVVGCLVNEMGANPNHQGKTGFTALHFAVNGNKPAVIPILMKAGADPLIAAATAPGKPSLTPARLAEKMKHKEAAEAILQYRGTAEAILPPPHFGQ